MGLFSQRPEHNEELPGLPGEPAHVETPAERLPDAAPAAAGSIDLLDLEGGTVMSIVIPVSPVIEIAQGQESAEDE